MAGGHALPNGSHYKRSLFPGACGSVAETALPPLNQRASLHELRIQAEAGLDQPHVDATADSQKSLRAGEAGQRLGHCLSGTEGAGGRLPASGAWPRLLQLPPIRPRSETHPTAPYSSDPKPSSSDRLSPDCARRFRTVNSMMESPLRTTPPVGPQSSPDPLPIEHKTMPRRVLFRGLRHQQPLSPPSSPRRCGRIRPSAPRHGRLAALIAGWYPTRLHRRRPDPFAVDGHGGAPRSPSSPSHRAICAGRRTWIGEA